MQMQPFPTGLQNSDSQLSRIRAHQARIKENVQNSGIVVWNVHFKDDQRVESILEAPPARTIGLELQQVAETCPTRSRQLLGRRNWSSN